MAVVILVAALVFGALQVFDDGADDTVDSTTGTTIVPTTVASGTPVSLPTPAQGASVTGETTCPAVDGSSARTTSFAQPPPSCLVAGKTYVADVQTSKGLVTIALDAVAAPRTVNNFVVLARYHYFDTLPFHRIIPGFVVQGGSPDATGSGSPGYTFADELPEAGAYKLGTVAMANSGSNTNGSQFFIVVGDGASLAPSYSIFGNVTAGMDVVQAIAAVGTPATSPNAGAPTEVVTIQSVTIKES